MPPALSAAPSYNDDFRDGLSMPRRAVAISGITSASVLTVLDTALLNVALPLMAVDTGLSASASVWFINAYQLTVVVCLLPLARLGERIGYARLFRFGLALYSLGALACAFSQSGVALMLFRVAQGLGAACAMSGSAALIRASYPSRLFSVGVGINTMAVTLSAAVGPALSSAVLALADWRWLFALMLPIGALAWSCSYMLPDTLRQKRKTDMVSLGLNALAFASTIIGLDSLGRRPWLGIVLLALSLATWRVWIWRDSRRESPLLPLDLFKLPPFRYAVLTSTLMFAAQMSSLVALPFYFHGNRGLGLAQTALLLTIWPITATAVTANSSRLLRRYGTPTLCASGGLLLILGISWVLSVPTDLHYAALIPGLLLGGIAIGLFQAPNTYEMLSSAPSPRSGVAGSMQALARVAGQTLGTTMAGLGLGMSDDSGAMIALMGAGALAFVAAGINVRRAMV